MNLSVDDLEMTRGLRVTLADIVFQKLEVDDDSVDGIFDLVADAGGEPADGRHAPRELQFRLDGLYRFKSVKSDERAHVLARFFVVDEIERRLNEATGFCTNFFVVERG